MLVSLYSPNGTYDALFLSNYASLNVRDQLLRVPGIGQVDLFGAGDYGMRVWLRPDRLAKLGLTRRRDPRSASRTCRRRPARSARRRRRPTRSSPTRCSAHGAAGRPRRSSSDIIVRPPPTARRSAASDVGRVELGSQRLQLLRRLDGKPAGRAGGLPAAGRQPAGRRPRASTRHGGPEALLPAGRGLQDRLRHHAAVRPRSRRSCTRWSRRWCWSSWWSSSSCRTGGRR
jgi:hypothetical protein